MIGIKKNGLLVVGVLGLFVALSACESESPCEEYVDRLCEEACACGGGECSIGDLASPGASLTFDSVDDCKALNGLGCLAEDGPDFSVCIAELDQASCQTGNGTDVYLVPECS